MARQRKFKRAEPFLEEPDEDAYSTRCRLCWPDLRALSSSSDSEDEVLERDPAAEPMGGQWEDLYSKEAMSFDVWPE